MILPLSFEVYKPKERLNAGDEYQSKPQIAAKIIRQLQAMGFQIDFYSSLLHHLFEIPVAQSIAAIPAHIQQDDFRQKVPPFEQAVDIGGREVRTGLVYLTIGWFLRHNLTSSTSASLNCSENGSIVVAIICISGSLD